MNEDFGAVLAAGGSSSRMNGGDKGPSKLLRDLGGRPVLCWSLETLLQSPRIRELCLVCREEELNAIAPLAADMAARLGSGKRVVFACAGPDRQSSVYNGVAALSEEWGYVVIHDAARPLLRPETLEAVCRDALTYGAATAAVPSKDTCKLSDSGGFVASTPDGCAAPPGLPPGAVPLWRGEGPPAGRELHRRLPAGRGRWGPGAAHARRLPEF